MADDNESDRFDHGRSIADIVCGSDDSDTSDDEIHKNDGSESRSDGEKPSKRARTEEEEVVIDDNSDNLNDELPAPPPMPEETRGRRGRGRGRGRGQGRGRRGGKGGVAMDEAEKKAEEAKELISAYDLLKFVSWNNIYFVLIFF